jgi:predicted GH43/DUF377 family glycosyl hydrolase
MKQAPSFRLSGAFLRILWSFLAFALSGTSALQAAPTTLADRFDNPPDEARPWAFWYWLKGAISKEGITADLEAMADHGLGGANLMPLISPDEVPFWEPPVETLSPEYWNMVRHAVNEADRLGLKLGFHVGPGFSLAGGPWITPELSMQRVVWSETTLELGIAKTVELQLEQPPAEEDYYGDLAVFAYPAFSGSAQGAERYRPRVLSSVEGDFSGLADPENDEAFRSDDAATITYVYPQPVLVRSLRVRPQGNNFQALRLRVEASEDGERFELVKALEPPRHGWQFSGQAYTYALPETRARYFRFVYDPAGSEPGAEDLDFAKWTPRLRVRGLELSSVPRINEFEGKSAAVWRIADWTDEAMPAIARHDLVDLSDHVSADGTLTWEAPAGDWHILRIGHTATGATNYTGGAAEGLEADKLNPEAIKLQFESWFGETERQVGEALFRRVVKVFHSDSWEAESQNWSPVLAAEFEARRGYALEPWLPVFAGIPVESAEASERFLHDLRKTISELINENYFGTLAELAHAHGTEFSSESVAPTMVSDNLRHHGTIDLPMGEFWLHSPTHDKPFDMRDAVTGAHIYGKRLIQAEAFTQLRIAWDEAPHNLKALGDQHFALGVNRFVFHVFMQTPWVDRLPGVSLNGVGLFFQRGQTWWEQGRAWVDYLARSQAVLQSGEPVADVAVFAGEELPSRSVTPDRLVPTLPGIFGEERVAAEKARLANVGLPRMQEPKGVRSSANSTDLGDWSDPLRGYAYDSLNLDVLLNHAKVRDGRLMLDGGAEYGVLVLPGERRMNPEGGKRMSVALAEKLLSFARQGLPIVLQEKPESVWSRTDDDTALERTIEALLAEPSVHLGAYTQDDFSAWGVERAVKIEEFHGGFAQDIAWTHRRTDAKEIFFLSNQQDANRRLKLSFRVAGRPPEVWNPVTGERLEASRWEVVNGRTELELQFAPSEALFVVFGESIESTSRDDGPNWIPAVPHQRLDAPWKVTFPGREEPVIYQRYLDSWTIHEDTAVSHFSGTATYTRTFDFDPSVAEGRVWLDLGMVKDVAEVWLNGEHLGIVWTAPWRLEVTDVLREGENSLRIEVTNTWHNALIADEARPENERQLWTNAPFRLEDEELEAAGLLGPVILLNEVPGREPPLPVIPVPEEISSNAREVSVAEMQAVYEEVKTPFKYGVVLKGGAGEKLDCPNVFRHGDKWYMMFVGITDGIGYQTFLAESDDLLHWTRLGTILPFPESGWDRWQGDGGVSLMDFTWGGSHELQTYGGRYWMSYIGGSMPGYETDPLSAGLASTLNPSLAEPWERFDGNPILSPNGPFTRPFEMKTVYKSHIIWDHEERLGWPFVMYYNGKEERGGGHEAIGMAVSEDLKTWHRYGEDWVVYNEGELPWAITGDPQIVKMGELWVMFYFGAFWKPGAFDTFAVSYDMVNWTKWEGEDLVSPSEPYDAQFAHKPWVIKHDGVVYHYYCAVGDEGRVIALATSKDLSVSSK